jgi:HK97 family phage major capsid protein
MNIEELRKRLPASLSEGRPGEAKSLAASEIRERSLAMDGITRKVEVERRSDLNATETRAFAQFVGEARELASVLDVATERDAVSTRTQNAADLARSFEPSSQNVTRDYGRPGEFRSHVSIGREQRTYDERNVGSFLQDAYNSQFNGDTAAASRIARHSQEMDVELRATGTSSFTTGLVVPSFLADQYAAMARAGRPTLNICRGVELPPDGMSVSVARVTTGTAVAVQATENTAVQNTDMAATLLTVPVNTYAGQQDVSRQAIERGTGVDQIVLADLIADYGRVVDTDAISGPGTGGRHTGILTTASTNAVTASTATVAGIFPKLADAIQRINNARFMPADVIIMHPRRWAFFLAAVDSQGRPLVVPNPSYGATNVMAEGVSGSPLANTGGGVVGSILGLPVVLDANIPTNLGAGTNEDRIIVACSADWLLYEQPASPLGLRFEQTLGQNLTVKIVVYGYSAFAGAQRYPAGTSILSGVALVPPTF